MRECLAASALLLLGACASDLHFLDADALTSVVLVHVDGDRIDAQAFALATTAAIRRDIPGSGELYALGYAEPLDELGLPEGPLELDPTGGPLPPAAQLHLLEGAGWRALDGRPRPLETARFAATSRCTRFGVREFTLALPELDEASFLVAVDPARALFATTHGAFFSVTADGPIPETSLSTTTPHAAAFRADDGTLWLAANDGRLVHGTLERGFDAAPPIPLPIAPPLRLTGAVGGAPLELFATNSTLEVVHFDGRQWRSVRASQGGPARRSNVALAWAEPGLAVLVGVGTSSITEVYADRPPRDVHLDIPPRPDTDAPYGVLRIAGTGVVVASRYMAMHLREDERWTPLPLPAVTPRPDAVLDLGDGTGLIGGQDGVLLQWRPDRVFCEPVVVGSGNAAHGLVKLGRGFAMISGGGAARVVVSVAGRGR